MIYFILFDYLPFLHKVIGIMPLSISAMAIEMYFHVKGLKFVLITSSSVDMMK